jgi:hypothetical protein
MPLQIMDACICEVLDMQGFIFPLGPMEYPPSDAPMDSTWLPGIQRHLPHAWVPSAVIMDKAVKHGNATMQPAMWDNHVMLLYSWSTLRAVWILDCFRGRLMLRYRYRLFTEFGAYMQGTHDGVDWIMQLNSWRSNQGSLKDKASAGGQPGRKRHKGGKGEEKGTKREGEGRETEFDIVELAKDAEVGQDIISKATQADWWNWVGGSMLIFGIGLVASNGDVPGMACLHGFKVPHLNSSNGPRF